MGWGLRWEVIVYGEELRELRSLAAIPSYQTGCCQLPTFDSEVGLYSRGHPNNSNERADDTTGLDCQGSRQRKLSAMRDNHGVRRATGSGVVVRGYDAKLDWTFSEPTGRYRPGKSEF